MSSMSCMHLTPREQERLLLSAGADLARRRLARGARLGAAEAVALVSDEICEMAWDDLPLEDVVRRAGEVVPPEAVAPGVASLVPLVEVEALFPHGTVLVHVDRPFGPPEPDGPGAVLPAVQSRELAPGRPRARATLRNTGSLPIWVSSHVPLGHLNPALEVTVTGSAGGEAPAGETARYRLDIPAGAAVQVPPGERRDVDVVLVGGAS
jgi:urease subunit gamma/beta